MMLTQFQDTDKKLWLCRKKSCKNLHSGNERNVWNKKMRVKTGPFLTIRKRAEDGCRTEAAITGHGARPNLHFVLSGPAQVRQHGLVSVALAVVALIFTTSLLPYENMKNPERLWSSIGIQIHIFWHMFHSHKSVLYLTCITVLWVGFFLCVLVRAKTNYTTEMSNTHPCVLYTASTAVTCNTETKSYSQKWAVHTLSWYTQIYHVHKHN